MEQVASDSAAARVGFSSSSAGGSVITFQFSPLSVLKIQKGDITEWSVDGSTDAIVNAANEQMLGGGGVDGAIHRAAGPELLDACRKVPEVRRGVRCPTGEARITPAFQLPVSHVIHTVGPIYDVDEHPEVSLSNAYRNSLKLAKENNIQYIAFPAISCGVYRYPSKEASRIAISVLKEFPDAFKEIHFVLFSDELYGVWLESASNDTGLQLLA
ncbi:macro domain-containing protein VPA0103-like isoform X4 [Zingiber officinale]|uniref:macro domain-containing protein VPA0103-like isoform X4 n=1 Tax=Zingiber officinale TaxID=94328 RepID=UPI001C4BE3EF|nr:macro domain-containing protein VPA0103-like isoform X4 [Zingiber officinale]